MPNTMERQPAESTGKASGTPEITGKESGTLDFDQP
jgi:hypothetical protein